MQKLERLPTGIPNLDDILQGGVPRGGVFIVQGQPGAGKTIFGNQVCFHHVAGGGRALYITLLAESHARMLTHIGQLSFFDEGAIPGKLYYISAFRTLEDEGLKGLLTLLRREMRAHDADLMVLDGLVAVEESAGSAREFKKFIHDLQSQASMADCTIFLLTGVADYAASPEHTMVDGVIEFQSRLYGRRAERELQIRKLRGGGFLRGQHSFHISDAGIAVYPRLEAYLARPSQPDERLDTAIASGIAVLDEMAGGGLPKGSATIIVGPSGIGKTTLGLHFLG